MQRRSFTKLLALGSGGQLIGEDEARAEAEADKDEDLRGADAVEAIVRAGAAEGKEEEPEDEEEEMANDAVFRRRM